MTRKGGKANVTAPARRDGQFPSQFPNIEPKTGLSPAGLHPENEPSIFYIPDLLTSTECKTLQLALLRQHPLKRVAHAQTRSIAWRDVDRVEFQSPELSTALWATGLADAMSQIPLQETMSWAGLNSKWRIYRYSEHQGFGPHFDEEDTDPVTRLRSHYTLLIYLSDVVSGGETVFYRSRGREAVAVRPCAGAALVHAQGSACLLHEGRPVGRGGVKWVLRSDVMVSRRRQD